MPVDSRRHTKGMGTAIPLLILAFACMAGCQFPGAHADSGADGQVFDSGESPDIVPYGFAGKTGADGKVYPETVNASESFYRDRLCEDEQAVYDVLVEGLYNLEDSIDVPQLVASPSMKRIWSCLRRDKVDMFWVDSALDAEFDSKTQLAYRVHPKYTASRDEIVEKRKWADETGLEVLTELRNRLGDENLEDNPRMREEIVSLISERASYDKSAAHGDSILGVFSDGRAVCSGYAKSAVWLMRESGIPAVYVVGNVSSGNGVEIEHAWIFAVDGGRAIWMDPTWYDESDARFGLEPRDGRWLRDGWDTLSKDHRITLPWERA